MSAAWKGSAPTARHSDDILLHAGCWVVRYELLRQVAKQLGWQIQENEDEDDGSWDVLWLDSSVSVERMNRLRPYQRLNHFPGMTDIARKAALAQTLQRFARYYPAKYKFVPRTYILPEQMPEVLSCFRSKQRKGHRKPTFIVKPSGGTMGRGIFLAREEGDLDAVTGTHVAQLYIERPLLVDGFKCDFRVYVLVRSVCPLRIDVFKEGLVRLATVPYRRPDGSNLGARRMHLTNSAINKTIKRDENNHPPQTKRAMSVLMQELDARGFDSGRTWAAICDIIVRTILPSQPALAHAYHASRSVRCHSIGRDGQGGSHTEQCMEVLGFDILLDHKAKPWLVEVNHSPSLNTDSDLDFRVKSAVVRLALQQMNISTAQRIGQAKRERDNSRQRLYGCKRASTAREGRVRTAACHEDSKCPLSTACTTHCEGGGVRAAAPGAASHFGLYFQQIFPAQKASEGEILRRAELLFLQRGCRCAYCTHLQSVLATGMAGVATSALARNVAVNRDPEAAPGCLDSKQEPAGMTQSDTRQQDAILQPSRGVAGSPAAYRSPGLAELGEVEKVIADSRAASRRLGRPTSATAARCALFAMTRESLRPWSGMQ